MSVFKKILCPTDFSDASYAALDKAVKLATDGVSEVCIVHVEPSLQDMLVSGALPTGHAAGQRAEAIRSLCAIIEDRTPNYIRTHAVLRQGDPASEITAVAREESVDLIVITKHGAGGHKPAILGSVVARVLRDASCSVLLIGSDDVLLKRDTAIQNASIAPISCVIDLTDKRSSNTCAL